MIMSRQGAAGSPKEPPRSFLRAKMVFKVAQESSTAALKNSDNDLKMKNVDIHKTIEKSMKIFDFSSSQGPLGAQIRIEKGFGITF